MTDHVRSNRALWDRWSPEWVDAGRRAWATHEMAWGIWDIAERDVGVIPDVADRDVIELGCGTGYWSAWLARRGARIFLRDAPLRSLCAPDTDEPAGDRLLRPYFGLHRLVWTDDGAVNFTLPVGALIRLFGAHGLEVVDCVELQAPPGAKTRFPYVTADWASRWPSEEIWRVRKR